MAPFPCQECPETAAKQPASFNKLVRVQPSVQPEGRLHADLIAARLACVTVWRPFLFTRSHPGYPSAAAETPALDVQLSHSSAA